jgi:hypothetical protein
MQSSSPSPPTPPTPTPPKRTVPSGVGLLNWNTL